jgi:hypothetical protein
LAAAIFIFWLLGPERQKVQPEKVVSEITQSVIAMPVVKDTISEPGKDDDQIR